MAGEKNTSNGFGLIELMIAVALGLLLLAAISQLFISSRLTYNTADALARVQENGRFAIEILRPEFRELGGQGFCAGRINIRSHLNDDCDDDVSALFDPATALIGWEYNDTGIGDEYTLPASLAPAGIARSEWQSRQADGTMLDLPTALAGRVVPGSDVLVVRRSNLLNVNVDGVQNNTNINTGAGSNDLPRRGIVMVLNCAEGGDLFQQSNNASDSSSLAKPTMSCTNPGPGNQPPGGSSWSMSHDSTSSVFGVEVVAFYIGHNAQRNEPGLYRLDLSRGLRAGDLQPEELVQGIENMQVLYGFSRPAPQGDGQLVDFWLTADQVTDWGLVIAVRLAVLARSQEGGDVQRQAFTYDLSRTLVTHPEDRLLRQPFATTIALRNRMVVQ